MRLFGYRLIDWIEHPIWLFKQAIWNYPLADGENKPWWQFWK